MEFKKYSDSQKNNANQYVKAIVEVFRNNEVYTPSANRKKQWQHIQDEFDGLNVNTAFIEKAIQDGLSQNDQELSEPLQKVVLETLTPNEREYARQIPVGFARTGDMNAIAFKTPSGVPSILFDVWGLARFINVFNKISFYTEDFDDKQIRDLITKNVDCFFDPKKGFFKTPEHQDFYTIWLCSSFTAAQEIFLTAHEYSHILCGHLDDDRFKSGKLSVLDTPVDEYIVDREMEFEADARAYDICQKVFSRELKKAEVGSENLLGHISNILPGQFELLILSIEVFFLYLELSEKISKIPLSASHPTARQRRDKIRNLRPSNITRSVDSARQWEDFYFMKIFPEFSSQDVPGSKKERRSLFSKIFRTNQREEILTTANCLFCESMRMELNDKQKKVLTDGTLICPICSTPWKEAFNHRKVNQKNRAILERFIKEQKL